MLECNLNLIVLAFVSCKFRPKLGAVNIMIFNYLGRSNEAFRVYLIKYEKLKYNQGTREI